MGDKLTGLEILSYKTLDVCLLWARRESSGILIQEIGRGTSIVRPTLTSRSTPMNPPRRHWRVVIGFGTSSEFGNPVSAPITIDDSRHVLTSSCCRRPGILKYSKLNTIAINSETRRLAYRTNCLPEKYVHRYDTIELHTRNRKAG